MSRWVFRIAGILVPIFLLSALLAWELSNYACERYSATARPATVMTDCFTGQVLFFLALMTVMILLAIISAALTIGAFIWNRNRISSHAGLSVTGG